MRRRTPPLLLSLAMVAGLLPTSTVAAQEADPPADSGAPLVISQFYGGGGNSNATFDQKFVEILNRSEEVIDLQGMSLQNGSAAGTGNIGNSAGQRATLPAYEVEPGTYALIGLNSGATGDPLPVAPDVEVSLNPAQAAGKLVLVDGEDGLGCNGGSAPCNDQQLDRIVDLLGYGNADFFEGDGAAPTLSSELAAFRAAAGCQDTDDNAADFTSGAPSPRNSDDDPVDCDAEIVIPDPAENVTIACEAPFTIVEGFASAEAEAASQATGKAITCTADGGSGDSDVEVTAVSPEPAAGEVTVTEVDGGDIEVRFSDDVPGLDPSLGGPRLYDVTVTVTDTADDELTASDTTSTRLVPNLRIGTLRGPVADDVDGRSHVSPYALGTPPFNSHPNAIGVTGVVTQLTLEENADGDFDFEGFFLQSLDGDADIDGIADGDPVLADGDATTSDGLFVSMGTFPTLRLDEPGNTPQAQQYRPEPGDIITIRGSVIENFDQTQINSPFLVDVRSAEDTGVEVPRDIEVVELTPPDDEREASVYFERRAGMQATVREGSVVISGNDFFAPSTSEFWLVDRDHPVAQRDDVDARRIFRPYHPLANPFDASSMAERIDQTGARLHIGSFGVKATSGDATELINPAISGQQLGDDATGGLLYSFSKYTVLPAAQPTLVGDADPAASSLQVLDGFAPDDEYSVMVYNVENLYDFRDDPFSACDVNPGDSPDFGANPGCTPDEGNANPPSSQPSFDYAPRSQDEYDQQRIDIAEQILTTLQAPDIITIQEAEKQDVCVPVFDEADPQASRLDCDLSAPQEGENASDNDRGSGALDVLDELAVEIFRLSDGEVRYEASGDGDNGRDVRGISQGFLHRVDRVELVPVDELLEDPVLGEGDAVDIPYPAVDERTELAPWVLEAANPKAVNAQLSEATRAQAQEVDGGIDGGRFPQTGYVFTRPAQVAKFRIFPDGVDGAAEPVERYVTSNHMSAGPGNRTVQRAEQANLNAAVGEAAVEAGGRALITGDFNVFPRPDDPFPAYGTDPDREPSDQLAAMYERGFENLHDTIIEEAPANTYSFIFQGISQILDHVFVDEATLDELVTARYIHVNTDFPADGQSTRPGRGASDHDPLYARFAFEAIEDEVPPPDRPQTREDCFGGGWRDFDDPSYRNQGQCVADVSTGGRAGGPGDAGHGGPASTPPGRAR